MGAIDWLSSWFTSNDSHDARKGRALSSTHEAFSLPTTTPSLFAHPDAFNPDLLGTPEADSNMSPYTYPPQSSTYAYSPTSTGSKKSRPASILPVYHQNPDHTPLSSPGNYPPLDQTWSRLRNWLAREYPELGDTLNYGILPQDLAQIELQFGFPLPTVIRESYLEVDGQEAESSAGCPEGLFFGLTLLPLEDVLEEWRFWRDVDSDPATGANPRLLEVMQSIPPNWIRRQYSSRGWMPLITDKAGNYIGVDLNPGEGGSVGQVIAFGRDFDTKVVLWRGDGQFGWARWLASFVDELESGEGFEVGVSNEYSDGSEDDVGYESYFYGGHGRGQGDVGGDGGAGGLRLVGEYRGWNSMEAWADRSVRKWYEVGLYQPSSADQPSVQVAGTSKAATDKGDGSTISAFTDAKADGPLVSSPGATSGTASSSHAPTPSRSAKSHSSSLSAIKPPAPLPVKLPGPDDISEPVFLQGDLEAGGRSIIRDASNAEETLQSSRRLGKRNPSKDASNIPLPNSPPVSKLIDISSPPPVSDKTEPPDLLTDTAPVLVTAPIEPSTPTPTPTNKHDASKPFPHQVTGSDDAPHTATIRLVGSDGTAGVGAAADEIVPPDDDPLEGDIKPDVSDEVVPVKQDKKKGITSGLKKLGNLGAGMRKKDSNSIP